MTLINLYMGRSAAASGLFQGQLGNICIGERDTHRGLGMYVCHTHTHTHTHTHFILTVSHCVPSLPISTLTLSLAQVPSSAPQMSASPSPGGPESPC